MGFSRATRNGIRRAGQFVNRGALAAWHLLLRNRMAIGLASLAWLILRSGAQPRRLSYPCQKAAAANVGLWAAALVPTAFVRSPHSRHAMHHHRGSSFQRRALVLGHTLVVASLLLLVGWAALRAYENATPAPAGFESSGVAAFDNPTPSTVAIVKDPALPTSDAEVDAMVRDAVAKAGGLAGIVSPGARVVIKPNLVVFDSQQYSVGYRLNGIVTDKRVVKTVVAMCKEAGAASVRIADGTASDFAWTHFDRDATWHAFHDAGYDVNWDGWFDDDPTVKLVDLNDASLGSSTWPPCDTTGPYVVCDNTNIVPPRSIDTNKVALVTLSNGVLRTQYWVPRALLRPDQGGDCDVLITVPTFKNHGNAAVTLALKNRVGCAPSDIYYYRGYEPNMKWGLVHSVSQGFPRDVSGDVPPPTTEENKLVNYSLVDLNLVRPQEFVVVDGLVGIMNGPVGDGGTVNRCSPYMGVIMASRDSVALDTIGSLMMGYNPNNIEYIWWAAHRGLGTMDPCSITIVGNHVASVRRNFPARGGSTPADSISPQITGISSIIQNSTVWGTVPVVGSGISDNIGVIKADLEVDGQVVAVNPCGGPIGVFSWNSTTVADGEHDLKITVYDAALNEKSYTRHVWVSNNSIGARADCDHDGDVDLSDFTKLQTCFNGPNAPTIIGCSCNLDFDQDGDVDLSDFATFQSCFNGPNQPAGCS